MTHEEIEKIAVELGNVLSYESYYVGSGYPAIEKAIAILISYRAQVEMEERGCLRHAIEKMSREYEGEIKETLKGIVRGLDEISLEQSRRHPTN